jgi:hypothetical protein
MRKCEHNIYEITVTAQVRNVRVGWPVHTFRLVVILNYHGLVSSAWAKIFVSLKSDYMQMNGVQS